MNNQYLKNNLIQKCIKLNFFSVQNVYQKEKDNEIHKLFEPLKPK